MTGTRFLALVAACTLALLAAGWLLPSWSFVINVAIAKAITVLGLVLLMRAGLVSFGQALFYCIGGYTAGVLAANYKISEALIVVPLAGVIAGVVGFLLGFLMRRYRDIFFAMLSLAFSMILFGVLVKSTSFGGTDGFNITSPTLFGMRITGQARFFGYALAVVLLALALVVAWRFTRTPVGMMADAIRENEIRVEYLGVSATRSIHILYTLAAVLAGLGGALNALTVGHVDPEMAFWTTSGEFVVIAVLGGSASLVTPIAAALILEVIRTFAYQHAPNAWQLVLGIVTLALIVFLPTGFAGLLRRQRGASGQSAAEAAN
jgi:branched-chain amino acid transport system permease protein